MFSLYVIGLYVTLCASQNTGTLNIETPLPMNIQVCSAPGSCQNEAGGIVLDAHWRWYHKIDDYDNCYVGNIWNSALCPDPDSCTANCAIEGIDQSEWGGTSTGNELSIRLVTQGQHSRNVGARTYLLDSSLQKYYMFKLINREFTFDVDVSQLACGMNGALYFVEMEADGGASRFPTNKGGAKYGTGYCDAQCPHSVKYINGKANSGNWEPSPTDPISEQTQCEGIECGDNASGDRYNGVCDKDGCDFASYRLGDRSYYGTGSNFKVDTSRKVTVVTQFITSDGTDNGDLQEIRRFYVQDGQRIENSFTNLPGLSSYDSITEDFCIESKRIFGDFDHHSQLGGLKEMGEALRRGVVLVFSLWTDHEANMLWLDSNYPVDANPSNPGVSRGPCPTDSGVPQDVENANPDATVRFSNIKFGAIGSTT
ncbi:hypothetical protein QYM36_007767 [Artemia franciscana]|uniref:cellulose 1,4-beta-cellobiosidase (non-reducing end) n=1 Tax=Artemia franciscana TaxID=6661 RepID=A0AA88IF79_ARTSF|nr:hypothetical protein QYM36_007767 [Artemia franciscana]